MKITEAAVEAGTSPRMLRYYEAEGLLSPGRGINGYREYGTDDVAVARRIVALSGAGLTLAAIRVVLPCATGDGESLRACPQVAPELRRQLTGIRAQIEALSDSADAVQRYLDGLTSRAGRVETRQARSSSAPRFDSVAALPRSTSG